MASLSLGLSPAISVSIALDPTQAPQPQSVQELLGENCRLKMMLDLMAMEVTKAKANNNASNAHCTIMTWAVTIAKDNLDHQKCTTYWVVKTSAHYVAHPAIKVEWNASQLNKAWHAKEAAEIEAQKATEEALHKAHIQLEIQTRMFSSEFWHFPFLSNISLAFFQL